MDASDWFLVWLYVTTHPSEETFRQERRNPEATLGIALLWMALAVVISGALVLVQGMYQSGSFTISGGLARLVSQMDLPSLLTDRIPVPLMGRSVVGLGAAIFAILSTLTGFLLSVGLLFLTARMLGGTGNFGTYAYLIASFSAPLTVVGSLLDYIPYAGGPLGVLLTIYQAVLTYYAVKAEHNLSRTKTIIAMIMPIIVLILLGIALALVLVLLGVE